MFIAALLLAAQASAAVPSDPFAFDIRCMLATGDLIENADPEVRRLGETASAFFLGRVDLRGGGADLTQRILAEGGQMREEGRQALLVACGRFMEERGRAMEQTGRRMMQGE